MSARSRLLLTLVVVLSTSPTFAVPQGASTRSSEEACRFPPIEEIIRAAGYPVRMEELQHSIDREEIVIAREEREAFVGEWVSIINSVLLVAVILLRRQDFVSRRATESPMGKPA